MVRISSRFRRAAMRFARDCSATRERRLRDRSPRARSTTKNFHAERVATNLESVAILGTRGEERTVISAPVPIDVLSAAGHSAVGPNRDGADDSGGRAVVQLSARDDRRRHRSHSARDASRSRRRIRRSILVNGKRRHASALVNLNGFVGRGAQAVDLERDSREHDRSHRDSSRRRRGAVRIGRDRRRDQHRAQERRAGRVQRRGRRERHDVQSRRDVAARVPRPDGRALGARRRRAARRR